MPPGNLYIRFRTQGALNFSQFLYVVAFNTNGNGQYPLATSISSYLNWSFELIFGNSAGGATYSLQQIYQNAGNYSVVPLTIPPQYVTLFNPDSDGTNNEFTFTFNRALITPFITPSPGPTLGPTAPPTIVPGVSTLWAMNFFTTDLNGNPEDSIGINGSTDTAPQCCTVTTTLASDQTFNKPIPPPVQAAGGPSAQIIAIEVANEP